MIDHKHEWIPLVISVGGATHRCHRCGAYGFQAELTESVTEIACAYCSGHSVTLEHPARKVGEDKRVKRPKEWHCRKHRVVHPEVTLGR